jgi:hypothetical protein
MNIVKKIAVATAILCAVTIANADEGLKIGATAQYIVTQPTGADASDYDMSFLGAGVGVAFQIPLGAISVNPEVAFLYRQLMTSTVDMGQAGKAEFSLKEFAISVPVTVRRNISDAYAGAGIQADLPLAPKLTRKISGTPGGTNDGEETSDVDDRTSLDLGIAIVAGYNVSENIAVNVKAVIGLTNPQKDSDAKTSFNQSSVGVTYFF